MEREWRLGGATSVCHHLVKPLLSLLAAVAVASHKVVRVRETRSTAVTLLNREQDHKIVYNPIPQSWFKGVEKLLKQSDIVIKVA